jgi:hypothetical protein
MIGCIVPFVAFCGVGVAAYSVLRSVPSRSTISPPVLPNIKIPSTRQLWDDVGGAPAPATIGGREMVFGRMRMEGDELYVVAVDPGTAQIAWRFGPFGTYDQGYQHTHYALAGGKLLVTDFKSTVHVFDPESHKETALAKVSDRVDAVCAPHTGATSAVWIGTIDKRGTTLDLATGTLKEGPRPSACDDLLSVGTAARILRHDASSGRAPKVEGFKAEHVYQDGDLAVASGHKSPGTATPWAVGFDPKTSAVRWNVAIPSVDPSVVRERSNDHEALGGGRFVTSYTTTGKGGTHVTAFDGRTGTRAWDITLSSAIGANLESSLVASAGYVYVARSSSLDIYDARSGTRTGVVGTSF